MNGSGPRGGAFPDDRGHGGFSLPGDMFMLCDQVWVSGSGCKKTRRAGGMDPMAGGQSGGRRMGRR
ncbi:hypothetical protein, partial [Komagataeibacter europaeus]|uniref:hypothetical protein n=1 Tax=Komagataeibacter europaeus TaxID=33995 RepID=UPI00222F3C25